MTRSAREVVELYNLVVWNERDFALAEELLGGVRHLVWDFGHGMEPGTRIAMAKYTLVGSAVLTVVIWALALLLH